MMMQYAFLSGLCAACAGMFGKLSGSNIFEDSLVIRVLLFGAMLLCNVTVWSLFVKALHQSNSSLTATIVSSTSNYLFTAFFGYFVLGETTSLFWWLGMLFIIIGLFVIVSEDNISYINIK